jgi:hypothetical protein
MKPHNPNRKCGTDEANGEHPKRLYRVYHEKTDIISVDVWAIDEEQAHAISCEIDSEDMELHNSKLIWTSTEEIEP